MTSRSAAAFLILAALAAGAARAEPWSLVFAAERDSTVFLGTDGSLLRAPFSLANRDTLWRARRGQHVVRFAVSPHGGRVAWITRGFDGDTTRLWIGVADGAEQRLRYFSLRPDRLGQTHAEPDVPTLADARVRGGRLVRAGPWMLRASSNTLAWTADGGQVLLGYDGGIAAVGSDARSGGAAGEALAIGLDALPPSAMILVDALLVEPAEDREPVSQYDLVHAGAWDLPVLNGRRLDPPSRGAAVLSRDSTGWTLREVPEWSAARARTVGAQSLWWARGRVVWSLGPGDAAPARVLRSRDDVLWLGFDAAHGDLLGVAGRQLWRRHESAGDPSAVIEAASGIERVLPSTTDASLALVTKDSLLVWDPSSGRSMRLASAGLDVRALFVGPEGEIVVQTGRGAKGEAALARANPSSDRLRPVAGDPGPGDVFQAVAHGAWILLCAPGPRAPRALGAYDVRNDRWRTVENPGISAWEPVR